MKKVLFIAACIGGFQGAMAQTGSVGIGTTNPDTNAILELQSSNKGLLLPRLALIHTDSMQPLNAHIQGMSVFNTQDTNNVTKGYYFNDGTKWNKIALESNSWGINGNSGTNDSINFIGTTDSQNVVIKQNNNRVGLFDKYNNIGLGLNALKNNINTSGNNIGIGINTVGALGTGNISANNIGIGRLALSKNTTGFSNIAISQWALENNTTGNSNVAIGVNSLASNTVGYVNIAIGGAAMNSTDSSYGNIAIGNTSFVMLNQGDRNVAIGNNSGMYLISGENNIFLGASTNPNISQTDSQQINIGNAIFGYKRKIGIGPAYAGNYFSSTSMTSGVIPTEQFEVDGSIKLRLINSYISSNVSDKIVVVDNNGVLKTANIQNALIMPGGSSTERPTTPTFGSIRYNSTIGRMEAYVNDVNGDGTQGDAGWRPL